MVRLVLFVLVCISVAVNACSNVALDQIEVELVNDVKEFLQLYPNVELIPLSTELQRGQMRYTLGNRISGDRLVATNTGSQRWSTPHDVQLTLTYPRSGTGSVVTFVEVYVTQTSIYGRGYVTSGGIGQRKIVVIIEASSTLEFTHSANIYGY